MEHLNYTGALAALNAGANVSRAAWEGQRLVAVDGEIYKGNITSAEVTVWEPTEDDVIAEDYYQLPQGKFHDPDPSIGIKPEDGKKD